MESVNELKLEHAESPTGSIIDPDLLPMNMKMFERMQLHYIWVRAETETTINNVCYCRRIQEYVHSQASISNVWAYLVLLFK